jgi:steroid delta-isomerase-like uncharacterized protein
VWNRGDIDAIESFLAETYTIHHDPGDPWHQQELSAEGFKERVRTSREPFPDQKFLIQSLLAEGDFVAMTWLWTATHEGDIPGFPATGKTIEMSGATLYYFEEGLLSGHWQVTDRLGVYQQLTANQNTAGS